MLSACGGSSSSTSPENLTDSLPNEMYKDSKGYEALTAYIFSHYANLEDGIEVMELSYSGSVDPRDNTKLSSSLNMDFVRGDNKNNIVNYSLTSKGSFSNNNVDISVGSFGNEKISNTYETYEPHLFSDKLIDFELLNKLIEKGIEQFKKDTNVENAYCDRFSIDKDDKQPQISITIKQRKFGVAISRHYTWTIDGSKQLK